MTDRNSPEYLREGLDEGRFVAAYTLNDHFEKDLVEQALADADIPHATRLAGESEFALIFEEAQGYGQVLVRTKDAERVAGLLQDIRASDAEAAETVRQMFSGETPADD